MNNQKVQLRIECKKLRNNLNSALISQKITEIISDWEIFKNAHNIMLFYPVGSELSLLDLLNTQGKNFYFPCVEGEYIYAARYTSFSAFKTGCYGIAEPCGKRLKDCSFVDLIFVPALAADLYGNRLGYGKGYYDRFLTLNKNALSVVPICSKLLFETIPAESHDVRVNYLITENDILQAIPL